MEYPIYQVDAFTDKVFQGNSAAVVPLSEWLPDETLQKIALENNLAETAFFIPTTDGFHLRWFTPTVEMDLCGHATLATSWVIYNELGYDKEQLTFQSLSGDLTVTKSEDKLTLNFPILSTTLADADARIEKAIGQPCLELHKGEKLWVAMYDDPDFIINNKPDLSVISNLNPEGLIITAPNNDHFENCDFVSRYYAPQIGIDEDPVTGAAHCMLAPIWAKKLNKTTMNARQVSLRGGDLELTLQDDRTFITGQAALYMKGTIYV